LRIFYKKGIRSVFIEGGEPFLWKEDNRNLDDVIKLAKDIGFKVVSIYTNGTFPIRTSVDTVFVSLDGLKETKDKLFLNLKEKREIIKRIINLKKKKHKILNSEACLKAVYKDNWKRPSKLYYVYVNNKLYQCCRAIGNDDICKNCGYLGYPEIIHILKLRPSAIYSALNYLPGN